MQIKLDRFKVLDSSEFQRYQRPHCELEAIFEYSDDGLFITDGQANTLRVNRSFERITGLARVDLVSTAGSMHTQKGDFYES